MADRALRDPLTEHLIRSTAPTAGGASALPQRTEGTRSRAGNAMARTRTGLLEGALRAVVKCGVRRTTMNDIAEIAGVAKATLYNHFRTKDDVWSALVASEVQAIAAECARLPLVDALNQAALLLSAHPAVRRMAETEPAALAALLVRAPHAAGWRAAQEAIRTRLVAEGRQGEDLVLRWLASHLSMPARDGLTRADAEALARCLPAAPPAG